MRNPSARSTSQEDDLVLFAPDPASETLAHVVAGGLRERGFRVRLLQGATQPVEGAIEVPPDFVLLWNGEPSVASPEVRAVLARALASSRNIVLVTETDLSAHPIERLPDGLAEIGRRPAIRFDPARAAESVALIARRLASDSALDERRLMRRVKRVFAAAVVFCLIGVALQTVPSLIRRWTQPGLPPPVAPFALYWTAVGQRQVAGEWRQFEVTDGATLYAGDRLRFIFSPSANGRAYVVSRDQRGDIRVLHPTDVVTGASRVEAGRVYPAPVADAWLTVEPDTAPQAIYLVASYDAIQNLEELIEEPTASAGERRQLVADTMAGLLDGRHAALSSRVWTARLQTIDRELAPAAGPGSVPVVLVDGSTVTRPMTAERGWVAASVEFRFTFSPAPGSSRPE